VDRAHHDSTAGGLQEWNTLLEKRPAAAVADQVAVTSTVIWTFIQSMIPHVVHAGDFNHIQSAAELYEAHAPLKTSLWLRHHSMR
jgi:hypothetical protein